MLIDCPVCGKRDVEEFSYWADASILYPDLDDGKEDWFNAVYQRENPAGDLNELWQHERGCRSFVKVRRNTITHEISSSALMGPFADRSESS